MHLTRGADKYFEEHKQSADLGRSSAHSGAILIAARGLSVFVQGVATIILARLLGPHDFGLVAIAFALVGFTPFLVDLGTTDACAQRKCITRGEISSLFWINATIGIALALLIAGGSNFIASIFSEPALVGITCSLSLTVVLTSLSLQHVALMRRVMQFRRIAMIDVASNVIGSAVAIAMALAGWGYWALAARPIVAAGATVVGVWVSCRWVPGWPRITAGVKEMVTFGLGITGFAMTDYGVRSMDRIVLGYVFGAGPLGYFQNAFLLYSNLLGVLTEPLHNIAVSGLSKLRDNLVEFKRSWAAALSALSFFSAGAFSVLAVTGQDIVVMLLGQKWAPAGPLLCIFAFRGIAQSVERSLGWLHVVAGRTDRWMRWGFFSGICQLLALIAGLPFGPLGVATAYAVVVFGLFIPALIYAGQPVGIGRRDVISAVGPQTFGAIVAVAAGLLVQQLALVDVAQLIRFAISGSICLAVYVGVVVLYFNVSGPLKLAVSMLRDMGVMRPRRIT